jgi:hypothetical protein
MLAIAAELRLRLLSGMDIARHSGRWRLSIIRMTRWPLPVIQFRIHLGISLGALMAFLHHDDSNALIIELRSNGLTDQEVLTLYLINE